MPYKVFGNCVHKINADGSKGELVKCHENKEEALNHMRALWANVHDSAIAEFSMAIVKATSKDGQMAWRSVNSDIEEDFFGERMSKELFVDFNKHIENNESIPDVFKSAICEEDWCGGMPYVSISHYKSGRGKANVPGEVKSVYVDGDALKSTGILYDTPLGKAVYKSLKKDIVEKSANPVRISIGFLDTEHSHADKFTFTRKSLTDKCRLCQEGIGDKIYKKGYLVHLALTRVPANPRTEMELEQKSMTTKIQDAESIIEDEEVLKTLDLKSMAEDVLVIKADAESADEDAMEDCEEGDEECMKKMHDKKMKSEKSELVEEAARKDVTPADKKRAEKEYGDVTYADAENKKYPIDTEEHIRAAWNYIHQERNAAKYSDHGATIKSKILAAWKRVIGGQPPSAEKSLAEESTVYSDGTTINISTMGQNIPPVVTAGLVSVTEKTPAEKSVAALLEKMATLKSQGLSGDAALAEIQKSFDELGNVVKAEFTVPPTPEEIAATKLGEIVRSALSEMLPQALAQTVAPLQSELAELRALTQARPQIKKEETPQPRNLNINLVQKAAIEALNKKMNPQDQFQKIANQSVGLQQ